MKGWNRFLYLTAGLVALSAILYAFHFFLFRDTHHIFIYLVGDVAFVPIEVLLVTVIIHRLLTYREKRTLLTKLNMVIGAFFGEVGTELLNIFAAHDADFDRVRPQVLVNQNWASRDFLGLQAARKMAAYDYTVEFDAASLDQLRDFLLARREFLLRLLENPALLEHESFTDMLWAVTHLTEELAHRASLHDLPAADYAHLAGDVTRAYARLLAEWLRYMEHLQRTYPYLFSLALRTNPFDPQAEVSLT
ncbi:MAG: hypothetical protein JSU81_11200 [Candidatus Coatesbacteria bacterium]|nr:MAG: hypothetical protein JSU81_11200 [Candidatus Coatesbacteria bacterium]